MVGSKGLGVGVSVFNTGRVPNTLLAILSLNTDDVELEDATGWFVIELARLEDLLEVHEGRRDVAGVGVVDTFVEEEEAEMRALAVRFSEGDGEGWLPPELELILRFLVLNRFIAKPLNLELESLVDIGGRTGPLPFAVVFVLTFSAEAIVNDPDPDPELLLLGSEEGRSGNALSYGREVKESDDLGFDVSLDVVGQSPEGGMVEALLCWMDSPWEDSDPDPE